MGGHSQRPKICAHLTDPFRFRFRQIWLNSALGVRASVYRNFTDILLDFGVGTFLEEGEEKVQLSLIRSKQCAFHRAINEPSALPLSPQRVAQNENVLHFELILVTFKIWHVR